MTKTKLDFLRHIGMKVCWAHKLSSSLGNCVRTTGGHSVVASSVLAHLCVSVSNFVFSLR